MRNVRWSLLVLAVLAVSVPARAGVPDGGTAPLIEPGLLDARAPGIVIARFADEVPDLGSIDGLEVTYRFRAVPAVAAVATPRAVRALAAVPGLERLEADRRIAFDLDTATIVSRAKEVWGGEDPVVVDGEVVDGAGVGIAIVDTGLDGTHPDFAGRVAGNFQVTPAGPVPVGPWSSHPSTSEGAHGTHVAGIASGSGAASDGRFRGVAPGSSLYGFNMYGGTLVLASIAFDWIVENGDEQTPPIRVVNNSWHCIPEACVDGANGSALHMELASLLASSGVVVTWAAGNVQGDGDIATTSIEARNPTPGIISVANYKDRLGTVDTGRRDLCLSSSSSWGSSYEPATWPDVSAPGRSIMSTWAMGPYSSSVGANVGRNPVTGADTYRELSGTSMAAPHVAGVVALMRQANPTLSPADVEYILKQTSTPLVGPPSEDASCGIDYVRADPTHPWHAANYAAGHGLVDARAAVEAALAFTVIPDPVPNETLPDDFIVMRPGVQADQTLYLTGEDDLTVAYPDADTPRMRAFDRTGRIVHTSDALGAARTIDALEVHAYIGSTAEANDLGGSRMGYLDYFADVYRVPEGGAPVLLGHSEMRSHHAYRTLMPNHRRFRMFLDEPVELAATDAIRVELSIFLRIRWPNQTGDPATNEYWNLWSESFTPSRVVLGTTVRRPDPDTREGCERRTDCAMVDESHPYEGVWCDEAVPIRLRWSGPVGSALYLHCDGVSFACPIVADGEPCERNVAVGPPTQDHGGACFYVMPDGARGGTGRCWALFPIGEA